MTNWIKCSERMPEPLHSVMLCQANDAPVIGWLFADGRFWCVLDRDWLEDVDFYTHWMPLPEPPSEEE